MIRSILVFTSIAFVSSVSLADVTLRQLSGTYIGSYTDRFDNKTKTCKAQIEIKRNRSGKEIAAVMISQPGTTVVDGQTVAKDLVGGIEQAPADENILQAEPYFLSEHVGGKVLVGVDTKMWITTSATGDLLSIKVKMRGTGIVGLLSPLMYMAGTMECTQLQRDADL